MDDVREQFNVLQLQLELEGSHTRRIIDAKYSKFLKIYSYTIRQK